MKGKTALVAASSKGLGKAIAAALAEEGANIMLSGRNEAALQDAAQELNVLGGVRCHMLYATLPTGRILKLLFIRQLKPMDRSICLSTMSEDQKAAVF